MLDFNYSCTCTTFFLLWLYFSVFRILVPWKTRFEIIQFLAVFTIKSTFWKFFSIPRIKTSSSAINSTSLSQIFSLMAAYWWGNLSTHCWAVQFSSTSKFQITEKNRKSTTNDLCNSEFPDSFFSYDYVDNKNMKQFTVLHCSSSRTFKRF